MPVPEGFFERAGRWVEADKADLDNEFEQHPNHLWEVADMLAMMKSERDDLKARLERTEAVVQLEVRAAAVDKITDKAAGAQVLLNADVRRRTEQVAEMDLVVDRLYALLSAVQAKTSALKHLSELFQAGYYVTSSGRKVARTRKRDDDDERG